MHEEFAAAFTLLRIETAKSLLQLLFLKGPLSEGMERSCASGVEIAASRVGVGTVGLEVE